MTLLIILLIIVLIYLFRQPIQRWLMRRFMLHVQNRMTEQAQQQQYQSNNQRQRSKKDKKPAKEKLNQADIMKKKFEKDQGEYVDFTIEKD